MGNVKGLAVYSPNPLRTLSVTLDKFPIPEKDKGKLIVQFFSRLDGKDKKLAESELALP